MYGDSVRVVDQTIAHGAPWNYRLYCWDEFEQTGNIRWGDKTQKFLFNHFSRFSYNLETGNINPTSGKYMDHVLGGSVYKIPQVLNLQVRYFQELKEIHETLLKPLAPAVITPERIAFGMIVLNGDHVLKQVLDSVYPLANQILVAEGPVKWWQTQGVTTSTDRTNKILDEYPDPRGIMKIVHGQYSEKDEQANAYMGYLDADYLFNLDSDEVWKPEDIETIVRLMRDNKYTSVGVRSCTFYGGFERYITGWEQKKDQFIRAFKVTKGSRWVTHRPPTISDPGWPASHLDSDTLFNQHGVQFYHMSYIFPRQVYDKTRYYQSLTSFGKCIDNYFQEVYLKWVNGDAAVRQALEETYQGVHEWKPQYREPTFTAEFQGELPKVLRDSLDELKTEFNLQRDMYSNISS